MKVCPQCEMSKEESAFCRNKNRPDGLQIYCRLCMATYQREWNLRTQFGLSVTDYEEMLASQGGVCAICGNPPKRNNLSVDHDHVTGKIRGILCPRCNLHVEWAIDHATEIAQYMEIANA